METPVQPITMLLDAIDIELKVLLQKDVAIFRAAAKQALTNDKK